MANSSLKLHYFDGRGRAEVSRIILAAAGKKYEDIRFTEATWPSLKPDAVFNQVPNLEIDGKKYGQSLAIHRFLAKEFGFYGSSNLDGLKIDQIVDLVEDLSNQTAYIFTLPDGPEKEKAIASAKKEKSPKFLAFFEQALKENGTGYFVGNKLTLADLAVFDMLTGFLLNYIDFNNNYPLLHKFVKAVEAHEKIGPYLASRPASQF